MCALKKYAGAMIPLRQLVAFPGTTITIDIGRTISKKGVEYARAHEDLLLFFTQIDSEIEIPVQSEIYPIGVLAKVVQVEEQAAISGYK